MIQIKRNNKVFFTLEDFGEGSKLSYQLMDHHYIILKFTTETPVYFEIGDSVEIPDFGYFELTSAYFPKNNDSDGYDYEMQMDAYYMSWKNKLCKYRPQHGANETSFKLTTTVGVHMNVILGNLKALGLTYNGKEFSVDYTTYNNKAFDVQKRFLIEYGSISILDALNAICSEDALNCEWWIDGSIIYLGYCEMEGQTTFEQDVNVLSMSYSESKSTYITRLYAFGSDRNIPKGYFTGADADVTTDGVATDYLMLPNKEVDSDGFYAKDGYLENVNVVKNDKQAIEGVVMFEEEYPKVESVVSSIKTYDSTVDNEDGTKTTQTFWQVTATDSFATSFESSWIKSNLTLGIKFTSGALMGMEFDVSFKVIDKVNYFEIVANDTYGRTLPDGVMCPKVGDKFFLFNWDATKITDTDLIPTAQLSLFDRAKQYYQKTMISNSNFTCTMDGDKFYNDGIYDYHPLGEQVKLINDIFAQVDADGKHYRNSRIIGMEIPLDIPYDHPQYTVGEKAATSRLGKLEDKVDSIKVNGMQIGGTGSGNGGGVYVIGMNDTTPASDSNVYSARRSRMEFLSRLYDGTAQGTITFQMLQKFIQGFRIGNNNEFSIDGSGNAILSSVLVNLLKSLDFNEAEQRGFAIKQRSDGKYQMLLTDLIVWGKAIFNTLLIRELSYVGGNIVLSPSAGKISYIKEVYSETTNELIGWKCYLLADDGTTATINSFKVEDQVRCKTFNIAPGVYENVSNKDYWRIVTKVSTENEVITDSEGHELYDGKKFAWIQIAKENCMEGSDNPAVGDTIVLMGNRSDRSRQHLLMMETEGDSAPTFTMYRGINSYSLKGKSIFDVGFNGINIVSKYYHITTVDGEKIWTPVYRGDWKEGTEYSYYDEVTWLGTRWLCISPEGQTTTDEPSEDSPYWKATTNIYKPQVILYTDIVYSGISIGETHNITCKLMLGDKDVSNGVASWKVTRKTNDSLDDAAWATKDKVKNFNGSIDIVWSNDGTEDDLGKGDTAKFVFTATTTTGKIHQEYIKV
nr:MAG TPA: tail protein [Caudoviricetes sp.]